MKSAVVLAEAAGSLPDLEVLPLSANVYSQEDSQGSRHLGEMSDR